MYHVMFMKAYHYKRLPYNNMGRVKRLMDSILSFAEFESANFENIKRKLEDMLSVTKFYGMATEKTKVNIIDEPFFPRPKGHMRKFKISFFDHKYTTFEFCLARRNAIKTLMDLALNAVTSNVTNHLLINKMEVPETLKMTLREEFYNEWARKRFPSYNITLVPFAESLKARGIDTRTLDLIMDDYMSRIELTLWVGYKEIDWEELVQETARLDYVSHVGPMHHLRQTIFILKNTAAVETVEQDLPLDLSLGPPRF